MRSAIVALVSLVISMRAARGEALHGLRVPPGFEVTEFAGSNLANDIYTLTVDPQGRIVVAGRGYIRILVDDDGDGKADRATDFSHNPRDGAMGMLWEGATLYVTGDGGLRRFHDRDGDGKADGPSELIRAMKTGGEHAAHAIRRGPDGWLYVLCGNNTGIDRSYATLSTSPIKDPVAGCVLRFAPSPFKSKETAKDGPGVRGVDCEIVAHGFRNPYGMDFNLDGELFTYDSDNERCVSLPWYEPTRFYHVIPGGHHGWLSPQRAQFWRMPPYFIDVVAPVCTLGRGSPTGVACYRHGQFPEEYRGGFFLCDWTFGKVHFVKPRWQAASYTGKPAVFLEAVGNNGFAPTGLVVHPASGDVYVSIGGRGTRGGVYRIRYPKGVAQGASNKSVARRMPDWRPAAKAEWLSQARNGGPLGRLRAFEMIHRHRDNFTPLEIKQAVYLSLDHPDRYVRQAVARLLDTLPRDQVTDLSRFARTMDGKLTLAFGLVSSHPDLALVEIALALEGDSKPGLDTRKTLARVIQLLWGDLVDRRHHGTVWEGYTARRDVPVKFRFLLDWITKEPPSRDRAANRENTRLLAMAGEGNPAVFNHVLTAWTLAPNDPIEDLHYLTVVSRLSGTRPAKLRVKMVDTLLSLERRYKEAKLQRDTHWPLRVSELYAALARDDEQLHETLMQHAGFGEPGHVLFTQAKGFDRRRAADLFFRKANADAGYAWNAGVIELLGELPHQGVRPTLERLWGQAGVDAAILPLLARNPLPADRDRFTAGLHSNTPATVRQCLEALGKLPPAQGRDRELETLALIRGLGQVDEKQKALREAIASRLAAVTGRKEFGADKQAWTLWFTKNHAALAAKLTNPDGVDIAAWNKRLARLDWTAGDASRGRGVFVRANCATCHSGSLALGPDLAGVTGRFSRDDLFTAILRPSRDVPARYQTTLVETRDGKLYQGIVIYDAVDSLILQTGATNTVRLLGDQIALRSATATSLMPAGLLDRLEDREIADLYAYMKNLGKGPPNK